LEKVTEEQAICSKCGSERAPRFFHSAPAGSPLLKKTIAEIGLPRWDILWARSGEQAIGIEVAGDRTF